MSSKTRKKLATNTAELSTLSLNEKILKECHELYTDPDNGLIKLSSGINVSLLAPRKKITILLIGNHSAGKSTFINWYVEEHILKTGVAIETQGFTFITSGRKRESLTGNATLHLYPHFSPLNKIKGIVDYLSTEISTSKQKKFSLITFIDTPGLVDGDMNYPFDVGKAILFLGDIADLIFVFFDPIGQALCKRTLNLVEALNNKHSEKIKMYLSKADEAGHEADRQKVLMQIVQELCKRPGLNKAGFDLPTIYIPNPNRPAKCLNQIEEICKDIEKTINRTVQSTLNTLESDCDHIESVIVQLLNQDAQNKTENLQSGIKSVILLIAGLTLPSIIFISLLLSTLNKDILHNTLGANFTDILQVYVTPFNLIWDSLPSNYQNIAIICFILTSILLLLLARYFARLHKTLSKKQKRALAEKREYVSQVVKNKKHQLYKQYLKQSIAEHDIYN